MKVKEDSEKDGLKLNIQKTKITANRWETMDTVRDFIIYLFIFLVSKSLQMVTAAMKLKDACCL